MSSPWFNTFDNDTVSTAPVIEIQAFRPLSFGISFASVRVTSIIDGSERLTWLARFSIAFDAKRPGTRMRTVTVQANFSYQASFGSKGPEYRAGQFVRMSELVRREG